MSVLGTVYLVHLDEPFGHARHYCGWAADLAGRMAHHRAGTGANLLRHVRAAGIGWRVVRTWSGDRHLERRIKVRGGLARACPLCLGRDPVVDHPLALCCPRCQVEAGTACRTRSGRSTSPHAARRALVRAVSPDPQPWAPWADALTLSETARRDASGSSTT